MSRFQIALDTDGPQTRQELCDTIKAYTILMSYPPRSIYVPLKTYQVWAWWPKDEQGAADASPPFLSADEIPEKIMGINLYVANQFRMA